MSRGGAHGTGPQSSCRGVFQKHFTIMQVFTARANLDRVILLVYRVPPREVEHFLPAPLAARELSGQALGAVLLARRRVLSARFLRKSSAGIQFAVHYLNVVDARHGKTRHDVFVVRRDTSSRLDAWIDHHGPRNRPHLARFDGHETGPGISLEVTSNDRRMHVCVTGHLTSQLPAQSVFLNTDQACDFLRDGLVRLGIVGRHRPGVAQAAAGLCRLVPLCVTRAESSIFGAGPSAIGSGARLDSAFWLQSVEFAWHTQQQLCCDGAPA